MRQRRDDRPRSSSGRRAVALSQSRSGRPVGSRVPQGRVTDIDFPATLRAAAPKQQGRGGAASFQFQPRDFRERVRETRVATLIVFVVDASGSMGAQQRMEASKGAVLSLLMDAYQRRDRVALITVRGAGAELVLPATDSVDMAHRRLAEIATGGRTPLWAGLDRARTLIETERRRDRDVVPLVVLVSDGRSNLGTDDLDPLAAVQAAAGALRRTGTRALVVDTERGFVRLGLARAIADALAGDYVALDDLGPVHLADAVRSHRSA